MRGSCLCTVLPNGHFLLRSASHSSPNLACDYFPANHIFNAKVIQRLERKQLSAMRYASSLASERLSHSLQLLRQSRFQCPLSSAKCFTEHAHPCLVTRCFKNRVIATERCLPLLQKQAILTSSDLSNFNSSSFLIQRIKPGKLRWFAMSDMICGCQPT